MNASVLYPFCAVVGQEDLKLALILNVINPAIGGVLIRGEKGTAKSTAVRALAGLLPSVKVFEGCSYNCDPEGRAWLCWHCLKGLGKLKVVERPVPFVNLPLNVTEDRLAGSIDFSMALKTGEKHFRPGLLARAHRGILYVDEVNLLDDHIVDLILSASASSWNVVEREGISFAHPSKFILIGTMNPEEGELRPQFLDRFGLCVDMKALEDLDYRVLLMERRSAYEASPAEFAKRFKKEELKLVARILKSRELIKQGVRVSTEIRRLISSLTAAAGTAGHRADLVIEQTAKALAAFDGRLEVEVGDVKKAAAYALPHRKRSYESSEGSSKADSSDRRDSSGRKDSRDSGHKQGSGRSIHSEAQRRTADKSPSSGERDGDAESGRKAAHRSIEKESGDKIFEIGAVFKVRRLTFRRDRIFRRGSGRRIRTRTVQRRGRYVKSSTLRGTRDIALDASLRAAAPHQRHRIIPEGMAVVIKPEDLREKVREKLVGSLLIFLVDASGSMGARGRMVATKGAVMSLLLDAYQRRDKVAVISFRKDGAVINLPPTTSVVLAAKLLKNMPVGGRTPLSAGLAKAQLLLQGYLAKEPTIRPILFLVTDGRCNVSLWGKPPVDEAVELIRRMANDKRVRFVVIDTEAPGIVSFGMARKLASAAGAQYFKVEHLRSDDLIKIVRESVQ